MLCLFNNEQKQKYEGKRDDGEKTQSELWSDPKYLINMASFFRWLIVGIAAPVELNQMGAMADTTAWKKNCTQCRQSFRL